MKSFFTILAAFTFLHVASAAAQPTRLRAPKIPAGERLNRGVSARDQTYAPSKGEEEWFQTWNYYLQSTDGHHIFANFAISNMGIGDHRCGLNLAVTVPGGKTLLKTVDHSGKHFRGSTRQIDMRCNKIRMTGDPHTLTLKGNVRTMDIDITLTQGPPGVDLGKVWLDGEKKNYARYNVPHLGSSFSGKIRYGGTWHAIAGVAAVEQYVSNVALFRFSTLWHRVRLFDGDTAMMLGGFDPSEEYKNGLYYFFVAQKGKVVHVTKDLEVNVSRRIKHGNSGYSVPADISLAIRDKGFALEGTIKRSRLIGQFDILAQLNPMLRAVVRVLFANPWIFRNKSEAKLTWRLADAPPVTLTGPAIHEVIYVND